MDENGGKDNQMTSAADVTKDANVQKVVIQDAETEIYLS